MERDAFELLLSRITATLAGKPLEPALAAELNATFPPTGPVFKAIEAACHEAIKDGWMCNREAGGIKYGRVAKPSPALGGFSIDVVDMADVRGPHHRHPQGEIDMIMPLEAGAVFDGHGAGWCVYGPGTAHYPSVRGGRALILYLLPAGAIEFTKA